MSSSFLGEIVLSSLLCVKNPPPPLVDRPNARAGDEAAQMEREERRRREREARERGGEADAKRKRRREGGIVAGRGEEGGFYYQIHFQSVFFPLPIFNFVISNFLRVLEGVLSF